MWYFGICKKINPQVLDMMWYCTPVVPWQQLHSSDLGWCTTGTNSVGFSGLLVVKSRCLHRPLKEAEAGEIARGLVVTGSECSQCVAKRTTWFLSADSWKSQQHNYSNTWQDAVANFSPTKEQAPKTRCVFFLFKKSSMWLQFNTIENGMARK